MQPPPNATVPAGEVTIAAQITGFSDLAGLTVTLNGQQVQAETGGRDERNWAPFLSPTLAPGEYEVRMVAVDVDGREGGFRWSFKVVEPEQPQAKPSQETSSAGTPAPASPSSPDSTPSAPKPGPTTSPVAPTAAPPTASPQAAPTAQANGVPLATPEPTTSERAPLQPTRPPEN